MRLRKTITVTDEAYEWILRIPRWANRHRFIAWVIGHPDPCEVNRMIASNPQPETVKRSELIIDAVKRLTSFQAQ